MDSQRRSSQRYPSHEPLQLRCDTWTEFVETYANDVCRGGMFVRTDDAPEPLSQIELRLTLPEGSAIHLRARVVHVVTPEQAAEPHHPAGMGVEFVELDAEQKNQISQLVEFARSQHENADPNASFSRSLFESGTSVPAREVAARLSQSPEAPARGPKHSQTAMAAVQAAALASSATTPRASRTNLPAVQPPAAASGEPGSSGTRPARAASTQLDPSLFANRPIVRTATGPLTAAECDASSGRGASRPGDASDSAQPPEASDLGLSAASVTAPANDASEPPRANTPAARPAGRLPSRAATGPLRATPNRTPTGPLDPGPNRAATGPLAAPRNRPATGPIGSTPHRSATGPLTPPNRAATGPLTPPNRAATAPVATSADRPASGPLGASPHRPASGPLGASPHRPASGPLGASPHRPASGPLGASPHRPASGPLGASPNRPASGPLGAGPSEASAPVSGGPDGALSASGQPQAPPQPTDLNRLKLVLNSLAHKHYDDAARLAREMLADNPGDPQVLKWQAICFARMSLTKSDTTHAAEHYEKALQYDPNNREAREYVRAFRRERKLNSLPFGRYFVKKK